MVIQNLKCFYLFQIRLVVEEGLNQLPYRNCEVVTPTGMCCVQNYLLNYLLLHVSMIIDCQNDGILKCLKVNRTRNFMQMKYYFLLKVELLIEPDGCLCFINCTADSSVCLFVGQKYDGLRYLRGNCGVSIMRSGITLDTFILLFLAFGFIKNFLSQS